MATVKEQVIINTLADEFRNVSGIKNAFDFAENPDTLNNSQLPAVMFFPAQFTSQQKAHHNVHRNEFEIAAILFVATRMDKGGRLKFLENDAMPFMYKTRQHFQSASVITRLLALGLTQATISSGLYGAGGPLLTHNGVEYIGIVFRWTFIEIN